MDLLKEAAIVLTACRDELLRPDDVVGWADRAIAENEKPPFWLIELSTLGSPRLQDYIALLRENTQGAVRQHHRLAAIILARENGRLGFQATVSRLFSATLLNTEDLNDRTDEEAALEERLESLLIEWDCGDDFLRFSRPLKTKFLGFFREYSASAGPVARVLAFGAQDRA